MLKTKSADLNQFISFVNRVQAIKGGTIKPLSELKLNMKLKESISESGAIP